MIDGACSVVTDIGSALYSLGDGVVCQAVATASGVFNFCHSGVYILTWWSGIIPKPVGIQ